MDNSGNRQNEKRRGFFKLLGAGALGAALLKFVPMKAVAKSGKKGKEFSESASGGGLQVRISPSAVKRSGGR